MQQCLDLLSLIKHILKAKLTFNNQTHNECDDFNVHAPELSYRAFTIYTHRFIENSNLRNNTLH
jgi:hypothetical protein